ncbi:hypothetical protein BDV06DRAFT_181572 [Aspergillus oleicola]
MVDLFLRVYLHPLLRSLPVCLFGLAMASLWVVAPSLESCYSNTTRPWSCPSFRGNSPATYATMDFSFPLTRLFPAATFAFKNGCRTWDRVILGGLGISLLTATICRKGEIVLTNG